MKKLFKRVPIKIIILIFCVSSSLVIFNSTNAKADTTLTLWYLEDDFVDDTFLNLIDEYEAAHSITINVVYKSPDTMRIDYKNEFSVGNAPDIIQGDAEWIPNLVHSDMILPISGEDFLEDYMDGAKRAVAYFARENGIYDFETLAYYGFPLSVDTLAFIYNEDEVSSATIPEISGSWTTEEFQAQITQMNDQSNPSDQQYGFTYYNFPETEQAIFLGAGGIMFNDFIIDRDHNQIASADSIDALKYMYDFTNLYELTPSYKSGYYVDTSNVVLTDLIYEDFSQNGNISSTMLYASQMKNLTAGGIFSDSSKLGIAPCPEDADGRAPYLDVKALMINSNTDYQDEATALAQYLTSKESMIEIAENELILPAILSCYDDSALESNSIIQSYKPLVEQSTGKLLSRFWIVVEDIFTQQTTTMVRGGQTAEVCSTAIEISWNFDILSTADTPGIGESIKPYDILGEKNAISGANSILIIGLIGISSLILIFMKKKGVK